jgi:hypothetical protein
MFLERKTVNENQRKAPRMCRGEITNASEHHQRARFQKVRRGCRDMKPKRDNWRVELVKSRHNLAPEVLSDYIRQHFSNDSLLSLRQLAPFVEEIRRRFRTLPRKLDIHGKRPTLCGHRKFSDWCKAVLNRSDRTVRYMLSGGNLKRSKQNGNSFHLTKERRELLKDIAAQENTTFSDLMNRIIDEYLEPREARV